jgi:hypothetical protein
VRRREPARSSQTGERRALKAFIARGPAMSSAKPGGTLIAFCEAVSTTSTPQSVIRNSSPATEHTPSTTISVS